MTEKELEQKLVRMIRRAGGVAYKFTSPSHVGVPDRLALLPGGRAVFVEVKAPETGRLRKIQEREIKRIEALGFKCVLLDDEEKLAEVLGEI